MPPKVAAVPYGKLLYIHRLFYCFVAFLFCIEEKSFLKGLCGHKKKIFPHYSIFSTILTLKKSKVAMNTFGSVILFLEQMAQWTGDLTKERVTYVACNHRNLCHFESPG